MKKWTRNDWICIIGGALVGAAFAAAIFYNL